MTTAGASGTAPRPRTRLLGAATIVSGAFLVLIVAAGAATGLVQGTTFNGYPADGPFQLYNPLRRLGEGQVIGRDFPFFHGVGTALVHFPLYSILGGGLLASEIARWTISPLLFVLSAFGVARLMLRDTRRAIIAAAVAVALTAPLGRMVDPSNSLLGIRTMLPVLAAALLCWTGSRALVRVGPLRIDLADLVLALALAGAVVFGTEHGLAASVAVILVRAIRELRTAGWATALVGSVVLTAVVALLVLLSLTTITAGHASTALRYALVEVPGDQGWVFGAPPNPSFSWAGFWLQLTHFDGGAFLARQPQPVVYVAGAVGATALVVLGRRHGVIRPEVVWGVLAMALYAVATMASITGYLNLADQMSPIGRVAALVGAVVLTALITAPRRRSARAVAVAAAGAVLVAMIAAATVVVEVGEARGIRSALATAPDRIGAGDRAILGPGWAASIDQVDALVPEDAVVWGTYTGVFESIRDQTGHSPGGEDYIIHALGDDRRERYAEALTEVAPDAVLTMDPVTFPYEEWIWSHWPQFMERLVTDYDPVGVAGPYVVWRPAAEPATRGGAAPAVVDERGIRLPANTGATTELYEVTVRYAADAPPLLGSTTRHLLIPQDTGLTTAVTLPPQDDRWTFLVPIRSGQREPYLEPLASGQFGGTLDIESATVRPLAVAASDLAPFDTNFCARTLDTGCDQDG